MSERVNKKVIKVISFMLLIICIVSLCFFLTRPVGLYDIINNRAIKSINVSAYVSGKVTYGLPNKSRFDLDNEQDINAIMSILNRYKYSKILKLNNPGVVPANPTNGVIDIYIFYINADNKLVDQYIFVDTENDVIIRNKNNINIDYKIEGNDKRLFQDLSSWLSEKQ